MQAEPLCLVCEHYWDRDRRRELRVTRLACSAFPGGIPGDILARRRDHLTPRKGDNGLVFTPKDLSDVPRKD